MRLIKSLYNNILAMFEVFSSVQIKPFCLKIGINNTKKTTFGVSAFPE